MPLEDDPDASRARQIVAVYGDPDEQQTRTPGPSRRSLGLAGVVAAGHAWALLAGHYAVAAALAVLALVAVGVVTDRLPRPRRGDPR